MTDKLRPDSKTVQMRLRDDTLERIERLKEKTRIDNRTRVVSASVELAEALSGFLDAGGELVVRSKDGTERVIQFVGPFANLSNPTGK